MTYARTASGGGFFLTSGVITGFAQTKGTAIGHNNLMYASGDSAGIGANNRYDQYGNFAGSFGQGQLNDPIALGVVIAPEPGTMLALGAGAAWLLRRRKKSA